MQLEAEGNCSKMYYDADLTERGSESVAHDTTVGSFSSKTPIKQLKIGSVREKKLQLLWFNYTKIFAHTQPIGKLISNEIILYPR